MQLKVEPRPRYLQQVEVQAAPGHIHHRHFTTSRCSTQEDGATRKHAAASTHTGRRSGPRQHHGRPGHPPVLQVWCHDAAEEADGWLQPWEGQTRPRRPSVHRAVGDGAVGGRPLRTDHRCSVLVQKTSAPPSGSTLTSDPQLSRSTWVRVDLERPGKTRSLTRYTQVCCLSTR